MAELWVEELEDELVMSWRAKWQGDASYNDRGEATENPQRIDNGTAFFVTIELDHK